jgi:hypothetical protein
MAIIPQYATATAGAGGGAVFMFPDVPQGELWCGTTNVPNAPTSFVGIVTASGQLLGQMNGAGSFGPWTCDYSQTLAITGSGLTPGTQYTAVWHADSRGAEFSTYPAPITPTVVSGPIIGTVDVGNFPPVQTVDGSVTVLPSLAGAVIGGSVTMTGAPVTLPAHSATQGVVLAAPLTNIHPVSLNGGFVLDADHETPLLPVSNSDLFIATGTGPDVLTFLVT